MKVAESSIPSSVAKKAANANNAGDGDAAAAAAKGKGKGKDEKKGKEGKKTEGSPPPNPRGPCLDHLWGKCTKDSKTCKFRHEYPTKVEWQNENLVKAYTARVTKWGPPTTGFKPPSAVAAAAAKPIAPTPKSPKAGADAKPKGFGPGYPGICMFWPKGTCRNGDKCSYYQPNSKNLATNTT